MPGWSPEAASPPCSASSTSARLYCSYRQLRSPPGWNCSRCGWPAIGFRRNDPAAHHVPFLQWNQKWLKPQTSWLTRESGSGKRSLPLGLSTADMLSVLLQCSALSKAMAAQSSTEPCRLVPASGTRPRRNADRGQPVVRRARQQWLLQSGSSRVSTSMKSSLHSSASSVTNNPAEWKGHCSSCSTCSAWRPGPSTSQQMQVQLLRRRCQAHRRATAWIVRAPSDGDRWPRPSRPVHPQPAPGSGRWRCRPGTPPAPRGGP